jgi:hypothetical protein
VQEKPVTESHEQINTHGELDEGRRQRTFESELSLFEGAPLTFEPISQIKTSDGCVLAPSLTPSLLSDVTGFEKSTVLECRAKQYL